MSGDAAPGPAPRNRSLTRAAAILDALEAGPLGVTELARVTGLSTSVVHRFATDMAELGFVQRTGSGAFEPGRRFTADRTAQLARPVVEALRDASGETAQYWVRRGSERLCLVSADSRQELRATLPEGTRLALPLGSAGRLLSHDPEALASIRERGWVSSSGKRTPGLCSVSAPVVVDGVLHGAVCIAAPLAHVEGGDPGEVFGNALVAAVRDLAGTIAAR